MLNVLICFLKFNKEQTTVDTKLKKYTRLTSCAPMIGLAVFSESVLKKNRKINKKPISSVRPLALKRHEVPKLQNEAIYLLFTLLSSFSF